MSSTMSTGITINMGGFMAQNFQYEKKLIVDLNWQVKARLDRIGEDVAFAKLDIKHNSKAVRKLKRRINILYGIVGALLLCILLFMLNIG